MFGHRCLSVLCEEFGSLQCNFRFVGPGGVEWDGQLAKNLAICWWMKSHIGSVFEGVMHVGDGSIPGIVTNHL
jgi:hypothetical protein